jgi:hypothetical protein
MYNYSDFKEGTSNDDTSTLKYKSNNLMLVNKL